MKILCSKCDKVMEEKGALIISPAFEFDTKYDTVCKIHICLHCWGGLWDWLQGDYDV